jgi:hypothetical protein
MSSEETPVPGFESFLPQVQQDVNGLAFLGHLEDSFEFCGHSFVIATLKGDEELAAGLVSKPFVDSIAQAKAWTWANVGMCLVEVDGERDFCPPIGPNQLENARARFRYVTSKWYWPLAEYIFTRLASLQERQEAAMEAMRDLSRGGPLTPSDSPDFWKAMGISPQDLTTDDQESPTDSDWN